MPIVLDGLAGPVELVTYGEAAELLDVRPQTIWTYVHRGVLHPIRLADATEYPAATPFLLGEEIAWYERRRGRGGHPVEDPGPSPYVERYAELLATGAAVPLLAAQAAELLARIRGAAPSIRLSAPSSTPTTPAPSSTAEALDTLDTLDTLDGLSDMPGLGWGMLAALLFLIVLAFILGRQPDAGKVAQLRAVPGAGRLPRALREAADLLDRAA